MKNLIYTFVLSSVLAACARDKQDPVYQYEEPMRNEVEMSFLGTENQDKNFGYGTEFSSVECRYDQANSSLRVVAYTFENNDTGMHIKERMQLTDFAVQSDKSGFLKPMEGDMVPSFIFLSDHVDIKYTNDSNCTTFYEFQGQELRGNVFCSALETGDNEKSFINVRFQCMNQNYLLFEIKQEMI